MARQMASRIMYMEPKVLKKHADNLTARIGRVTFSKSGKTIRYHDKQFTRIRGGCPNYMDDATGERYWISGCKKRGGDRLFPGMVVIDEDVCEEYWTEIRNKPEFKHVKSFRG